MDISIIAGKCSEDNNRRIFEILKNRDRAGKKPPKIVILRIFIETHQKTDNKKEDYYEEDKRRA